MSLESFQAILTSGIVLGSLYALMASGLSLVWSTLGIFNFMHGVMMATGAYLAWQFSSAMGWGLVIGILLALLAMIVLGGLAEWLLIRPFYGRKDLVQVTVMTTLAGLTFLENGNLLVWGPRLKKLPELASGTVSFLGFNLSGQDVLVILISPIVLLALWAFLKYTALGKAIRAVGQNRESAALLGLDVRMLFLIAFASAAVLATIAGILLGSIRFITPTMGNDPLLKALIVAIFGGLGNISGSIAAAYVIGLLEAFSIFVVGQYWTPSLLFVIMIVVLLFRPNGLFGASR